MTGSIDDIIEERKEEAQNKQIARKAMIIVNSFGRAEGTRFGQMSSYTTATFKESRLKINGTYSTIEYSSGSTGDVGGTEESQSAEIIYDGKSVFRGSKMNCGTYIPGPDTWEKELEGYYNKALPIHEKKERQFEETKEAEKERKETGKRNDWGL